MSELHDLEFLDTLQDAALRRGDRLRAHHLGVAADELALNRIARATCPDGPLDAAELVAHVYRIAADVAEAKRRL